MENPKLEQALRNALQPPAKGIGDALTDPPKEVFSAVLDEIADVAKKELLRRDGLPTEEPRGDSPLPRNSILRQAKTAEELGLTDADVVPWTPDMDMKRVRKVK